MLGVGAELSPETDLEIAMSLVIILLGISAYATLIGSVGDIISSLNSGQLVYQAKMETIVCVVT